MTATNFIYFTVKMYVLDRLQSFDIWGTDLAINSETTFYRQFVSLLDKMFMKTNVELFE